MKSPMLKSVIFCFNLLLFNIEQGQAQIVLPQPIISKFTNTNLLVRWEPASLDEWAEAQITGYTIDVLGQNDEKLYSVNVAPFKPSQFQSVIKEAPTELVPFFDACLGIIHPSKSGSGESINRILDQMVQTSEQTIDSFRLSMLSFYGCYDMRLATAVGLGITIPNLSQRPIKCNIYVNGFPLRSHRIEPEMKHGLIPSIIAKWGDRKVRLEWDVENKHTQYIGYFVERSADGSKFTKLNPLPYLDPAVGIDGKKGGAILGIEDSLSINYKDFYYRLKTLDYFGNTSEPSSMVKGYGFDVLKNSPQITYADQEIDNHAHLKWVINDQDIPLITGISVLRSDRIDGKYDSIDTLSSEVREAHIPMVYETNYYRIEIIPKDGETLSSFPVFVMGIDSIPPVTPIVIGAIIDTLGRVSISWHPNSESDLWGYKIFRSNFDSDEYSLQSETPILDTIFIDSVSLHLGVKNVYYVLQAVDKRNNRSPFTSPIILERPDIIPPGVPIIKKLVQNQDTVKVFWLKSGSDDVVLHELFRRNLDKEESWQLVQEFDATNMDSLYNDLGLSFGNRYAYTMRATDDVNLESSMAKMQVIHLVAPKENFDPQIKVETDYNVDSKTIQLKWTCVQQENVSSILVYRGWDENKLGKYKYVEASESDLTDSIEKQPKVYYRLKINYKGNTESYLSDVVGYVIQK